MCPSVEVFFLYYKFPSHKKKLAKEKTWRLFCGQEFLNYFIDINILKNKTLK